ncbi:MAG: hypothetical protein F6K40_09340 [Okeania sp. SIO3I5]|uniref:hypothetical protein n=1 Tax=Okeania sp. SIO3I5 TaxID=2607805 RepID=UPI0013B61B21|nr:hypothetical protein [Okeania sp. SIO3I5]NEQ36466.1 hypothetical protein [Okeania sp. SIO3I5]
MALILIADRSPQERSKLRKMIEELDHIVVEADEINYTKDLIEVHPIDCALLEQKMVEESELISLLEKLKISAIAISDYNIETPQGFLGIVPHSPSPNQLAEIIAIALNQDSSFNLNHTPNSSVLPSTQLSSANDNWQTIFSIQTLQNLLAIAIDKAGVTLNEMTDFPIIFQDTKVEATSYQKLHEQLTKIFGSEKICVTQLPFYGGFSGTSQLFFLTDSANILTELLTGEEPGSEDFEQAQIEMLTEIGNVVLNTVMGTMSNAMTKNLEYAVPKYLEDTLDCLLENMISSSAQTILLAQAHFMTEETQIKGDIILFFQVN